MCPHRCALTLLFCILLLGGCSRLDLAYRNLDQLIIWSLDDYLPLNRAQKDWLNPRLSEHLYWHCRTQLPAYSAWLQRSETLLAQPSVPPAAVGEQLAHFRQELDAIAVALTPTSTELLRGLQPGQVEALEAALREQQAELHEEYLRPSLEEQADQRSARLQERLEPWFGDLNATQRRAVDAWARQLGEQNRIWLNNRWHWQGKLRAALRERQDAAFAGRLQSLLQDSEQHWTPAYREQFARSQQALSELFSSLLNAADSAQRAHMRQRLAALREDLDGLACQAPAAAAVVAQTL